MRKPAMIICIGLVLLILLFGACKNQSPSPQSSNPASSPLATQTSANPVAVKPIVLKGITAFPVSNTGLLMVPQMSLLHKHDLSSYSGELTQLKSYFKPNSGAIMPI